MGTTPADLADEYERADTGENADPTGSPVQVEVVGALDVTEHPPRNLATEQIPVPVGQIVRVVGEVRTRARCTIVARGGAAALIGGPGVSTGTGFMLPADAGYETVATCAIYATATAEGTTLHVITEHRDGA